VTTPITRALQNVKAHLALIGIHTKLTSKREKNRLVHSLLLPRCQFVNVTEYTDGQLVTAVMGVTYERSSGEVTEPFLRWIVAHHFFNRMAKKDPAK
jgi:hypothetical protein